MNCDLIFFFSFGGGGEDSHLNSCVVASLWARAQFPILPNILQEL